MIIKKNSHTGPIVRVMAAILFLTFPLVPGRGHHARGPDVVHTVRRLDSCFPHLSLVTGKYSTVGVLYIVTVLCILYRTNRTVGGALHPLLEGEASAVDGLYMLYIYMRNGAVRVVCILYRRNGTVRGSEYSLHEEVENVR
jgi:hypothetical protein